jgi:hypothetical protein
MSIHTCSLKETLRLDFLLTKRKKNTRQKVRQCRIKRNMNFVNFFGCFELEKILEHQNEPKKIFNKKYIVIIIYIVFLR